SGDSMRDVSGVTGAGPIWHDIMVYLHGARGSRQPPTPAGVHGSRVSFEDGIEPSRMDYFVGDTALAQVRRARDVQDGWLEPVRIAAPQDGTVLAVDPDIPPRNQRVVFRASGADPLLDRVGWRIDGGRAVQGREMLWLPLPGMHRVELLGKDGRVLDSVTLTVRGAMLAAPRDEAAYLD